MFEWRHDTRHNNICHNDTQHNNTQHKHTQRNNIHHNDSIMVLPGTLVVWCLIKRMKVTAQFSDFKTAQNLVIPNLIDICFSSLFQNLRCPFQLPFPTHAVFDLLLRSFSCSCNPLFLSLSSAYSPLYFYLLPFHINSLMIFIKRHHWIKLFAQTRCFTWGLLTIH